MSRQTAFITLEKFSFSKNIGKIGPGTVGMEYRLLNPRPNVALRKRAYAIEVNAKGQPTMPNTLAGRILFKESVDGPLGIHLDITGVEDPNQFEVF